MMIPTPGHQSQVEFVVLDPSCSFGAQDTPELQDMSQEKVGRHYEFECGFGVPLLKKYRAQSPQTPETPKRHQHCRLQAWLRAFGAQDTSELHDMSQEKVGRYYEFERGFGIPLLKKYRAQSPQTPVTGPLRRRRGTNTAAFKPASGFDASRIE